MKRARIGILIIAALATTSILAANGCSRWIAHAIVDAPNKGVAQVPPAPRAEFEALGVSRAERIEVGPPSAELDCWIIDPTQSPRGTVVVLHGVRDRKRTQVGLGRKLAEQGYRAVLIDLRGHGESTGDFITYGVVESRDLAQALDALDARGLIHEPIGVIGASFGGACAIKLAAIDERVKAVIAIATYTSLRDVVPNYLGRMGMGWLVSDATLEDSFAIAGELASFNATEANPIEAIGKVHAPVLLIHGDEDSHIPPDHSQRLHEAAPEHSKLVIIPAANHDTIMMDRDGTIWRETLAWLTEYLE